jgi:hypothetical protein
VKPSAHALRRLSLALAIVAGAAFPHKASAQARNAPALPAPEKFFGHVMGADRKLAGWDKLHEHYQLLAKSSNRMKLVELPTRP